MKSSNTLWKNTLHWLGVLCIVVSLPLSSPAQQPRLAKDYSFVMEIPAIEAIESSLTHVYVLSRAEGLSVFRSRPDTLQWLYTSPGMSKRGRQLDADIRFAYLYGEQKRFSVIEPTSVVGVYSSTSLPVKPDGVHRIGNELFLGLDSLGIGRLSLETPSSFDSTVTYVNKESGSSSTILHVTGDGPSLFAATDDPAILEYQLNDGNLALENSIETDRPYTYLYPWENQIYAATPEGDIVHIKSDGIIKSIGTIEEAVQKIRRWKQWLIIRGESRRIWTSFKGGQPALWKDNGKAGNYFATNKGRFWINEYNKISQIKQVDPLAESRKDTLGLFTNIDSLNIKPIQNYTTPLPHPVLVPIELKESYPVEAIQLTYESPSIEDAYLRKQGFYWQPGSDDTGSHRVTIIATASSGATDSVQFNIEVNSFNTPPRFAPLRTVTVPVGETYSQPIKAFDPDGTYPDLIRYLGRDLPEGSSINQQTGEFKWTPAANQKGTHTFRVIATDQFGAASSKEVELRVIAKPERDQ